MNYIYRGGDSPLTGPKGTQDSSSRLEAISGSMSLGLTASILGFTKLRQADIQSLTDNKIQFANIINNVTWIMYDLMRYYFRPDKIEPAAMIAGIPLGTVDELSHAMSNRELKYRATHGVFLAHQEGGDRSLRIVGKAWGKNRFLFLSMIQFLFLYGAARQVDLMTDHLYKVQYPELVPEEDLTPKLGKGIGETTTNPWQEFYAAAIDAGNTESHLTFPVVTREGVYSNMYIETYDYVDSVEQGLHVLEYSIFLRKYRPEAAKDFVAVKEVDEEDDEEVRFYYRDTEDDEGQKTINMIDTLMDIGYSAILLGYRTVKYLQRTEFSLPQEAAIEGAVNISAGKDMIREMTIQRKQSLVGITTPVYA